MSEKAPPVLTASAVNVPRQRLAICVLLAAGMHAAVILVVDLPPTQSVKPAPTLELRLAAGDAKASRHTRPASLEQGAGARTRTPVERPVEASKTRSIESAATRPTLPREEPAEPAADNASSPVAGRSAREIARAIAAMDADHDRAASRPRVRSSNKGPAHNADVDYYLDSWRRKVERIGNINYPREAQVNGLTGTLRLLVAIASDGTLSDVRVLESSGHDVLDDAAVRIVKLAAPYSPFPPRMRDSMGLLTIERTWQFRRNRFTPAP